MRNFHSLVILHLRNNLEAVFHLSSVASVLSRCPCLKVELHKFIPMQSQYSSHSSMLMEKMLCQHSLLTAKVTVIRGGGGDGSRAALKDRGRDVIPLVHCQDSWDEWHCGSCSPAPVAHISPIYLPSPTFTDTNRFAGEWIDYLPSQSDSHSLWSPSHCPSSCLSLPVANSIMKCLSDRSCLRWLHSQWPSTLQDLTRKRSLCMEHVESAEGCLYVHTHIPVLYTLCAWAHMNVYLKY